MAVYGYVRISTPKQSIDRQIRNIKEIYPDALIVQEVYTGTSSNRKKFVKLCSSLASGDTVVFDSVNRMSRNAEDGINTYFELYEKGVNLVFLKEPYINTDAYRSSISNQIAQLNKCDSAIIKPILDGINEYIINLAKQQIETAFIQAEKEVEDIRQKTREGLLTARLNGKQIGQLKGNKLTTKKSVAAKKIILKHSKDFGGSLSDQDVIKLAGISRNSYYKYKQELRNCAID